MQTDRPEIKLITALTFFLSISLTGVSLAWASTKEVGGTKVNVLVANDPLQIRSAKLWMRNGPDEERCSSSIVAKNVLLTAAHCVVDWKADHMQVRLSSKASDKWEDGIQINVSEIIFPKDIDQNLIRKSKQGISNKIFDILDYALIVLEDEVPAPFLPTKLSDTADPRMAKYLVVTGFGTSMSPGQSGYFHKFTADAFEADGLGTEVYLRTQMCSGDSGGGVFEVDASGELKLTAVNSRGGVCGPEEATWLPAQASKWIRSILEDLKNSK